MSPLWKGTKAKEKKKLLTILERPSSKHNNHNLKFIPYIFSIPDDKSPVYTGSFRFIEGTSLPASYGQKRDGVMRASMTVEAVFVLPLFLLFFLNLGSIPEMIRLHVNMEMALWNIGRELAVYGSVIDDEQYDGGVADAVELVLAHTYVKGRVTDWLGAGYLDSSPLESGAENLQFWEGNLVDSEGHIEIVATYPVTVWAGWGSVPKFRLANRYYGHLWNGYKIPGTDNGEEIPEYVYVTEEGTVYHIKEDCSYLDLSIRSVSLSAALNSRNIYGKKYISCDKCYVYAGGVDVLVTDEGECYHSDRTCPGLKRTVRNLLQTEVDGYRMCTRCGGG